MSGLVVSDGRGKSLIKFSYRHESSERVDIARQFMELQIRNLNRGSVRRSVNNAIGVHLLNGIAAPYQSSGDSEAMLLFKQLEDLSDIFHVVFTLVVV